MVEAYLHLRRLLHLQTAVNAKQVSMKNPSALRMLVESASHAAACHVVPLVRLGMGVETVNRGAVSRVVFVILESTGLAANYQVLEAAVIAPAARLASF